jgi:hypothetical protein
MSVYSGMTVDDMLDRASTTAGLDDFGPGTFLEGLERVIRSTERSRAPASLIDRQWADCIAQLVNRLRVVDYARRHPAVLARDVERPVIVMGLPRTGSTLTSNLLDCDPARRSLLLWEARDSVPPARSESLRSDPRCVSLLAQQQRELDRDPDTVRAHVEFADGPTECGTVHAQDFKATVWEHLLPVPEYGEWLLTADMRSAYEYERLVLQVLQSHAPGRWALKLPAHALFIDAAAEAFPEARFVWTHRDPYRVTGSYFSAKSNKWFDYGAVPDRRAAVAELREHHLGRLAEYVNRPLRHREAHGDERFYDLHYAELLRNPLGEMAKLYAWLGDELTLDTDAAMRRWLAENPQGRFGNHVYDLEQFGLGPELLEGYFGDYIARFAPEPEGA